MEPLAPSGKISPHVQLEEPASLDSGLDGDDPYFHAVFAAGQ